VVEVEAIGCTYQYGWRVIQEKVVGGTQLRSVGCLVNGVSCDVALNGDLPPPDVDLESEIAELQRQLLELSERVQQMTEIVHSLVGHTHEITVGRSEP